MHPRAVSVENPADPNSQLVHPVIIHEQRFRSTLPFVITSPHPDWIDAAAIRLRLRMNFRIAIDFAGRRLKDLGVATFCHPQQIDRAYYAGLHCLDRVVLIVSRGSRTSQVVDFVDFQVQRMNNVVANQLEIGLSEQMNNVGLLAGKEVVDTDDVMPFVHQAFTQMRT